MDAYGIARREHLIPPQMEQPEYNLFRRERVEREYAGLYKKIGLGTTVWSPLASGLLTGKYNKGIPEGSRLSLKEYGWLRKMVLGDQAKERIGKVKALESIAKKLGCPVAQLALAWCLKNPNVSTVITGATGGDQVRENMQSLDVVKKLTDEIMKEIDGIFRNKPTLPPDWR
jgi:aryl-alcohol dehydrogenase-like predicted oxidoreductase